MPFGDQRTSRLQFHGRDSWWLFGTCVLAGLALGFFANVAADQSLRYSFVIGVISAGMLGLPVLVLMTLDRWRQKRQSRRRLSA